MDLFIFIGRFHAFSALCQFWAWDVCYFPNFKVMIGTITFGSLKNFPIELQTIVCQQADFREDTHCKYFTYLYVAVAS